MTDPTPDDLSPARREQVLLGLAITAMRKRRGFTQATAAERFDVSTQAWGRYEKGERRLPEHKLRDIAVALGGDLEELMLERARLDDPAGGGSVIGLGDRGRAFLGGQSPRAGLINELAALLGPHADRLRLDTSALSPWAESGELIIFDRERPPRRGQGCVVEAEGRLSVWIFGERDGDSLKVTRPSGAEQTRTFAESEFTGVFAVRFRGD